MKKAVFLLSIVLLGTAALAQRPGDLPGPVQVGEEMALGFVSPEFAGPQVPSRTDVAWSQEIYVPGASYVTPHFDRFNLPPHATLVVRDPDSSRSWSYTGRGKTLNGKPMKEFWGIHIPGEMAIVEIHSSVPVGRGAVRIDKIAHGYPNLEQQDLFKLDFAFEREMGAKALCGTDDSEAAKCYNPSTMYTRAKAVARLYINGSSACTGWLVGSEGHLMTNEHCIGTDADAANTDYEFMGESAGCTNCNTWMGCPGTVEANSATRIQTNAALDYTLVKLPTNVSGTYGYLQLRDTGAVLNERIYNPAHPQAWAKRISVYSTHAQDQSGFCEIYSLNAAPCSGGPGDIGYYCDTQGGSSGSPILAYDDHCVVSLHHCANCPNRGLDIVDIISDLGSNLPADSICNACSPSPIADAGADQQICPGGNAQIGTAAQSGHTYSWSPGGMTVAQPTVSPSSTTTYTVTATTSCGSDNDSVTVTVLPSGGGGGLTEDFEGGLGSWTASGLWHVASSCAGTGGGSGAAYYGQDSGCRAAPTTPAAPTPAT
jgi:hypothetical protein